MHCFVNHAQISVLDQFTKFYRLTSGAIREGVKIVLEFSYLTRRQVFTKPKTPSKTEKKLSKSFRIWFLVHCLAEHTQKSVQDKYTKHCCLNSKAIREGAKIILKLPFLTWRRLLRKSQRALSHREKTEKLSKFVSGCTVWQCTLHNILNINLPNCISWLQEPLRKEQNLF